MNQLERFTLNLEDFEIISGVTKHATHDQSSHGNWAQGDAYRNELDFDEDLHGEDLQNEYFDRYGVTTGENKQPTGVTMQEIEAVNDYSGDMFYAINGTLRGTMTTDLSSPIERQNKIRTQKSIEALDKVIADAPVSFGDKNLYRVYAKSVLADLEEGAIIKDKGFLSTTRLNLTYEDYHDVRESIGLISGSDDMLAVIQPNQNKNGKGLAVDAFKNSIQDFATGIPKASLEREVLLPRNTPLRFIGFKTNVGIETDFAIFQRMDK